MATFAKLDITNTVTKLIKVGNDVPTSNGPLGENDMHVDGGTYCQNLLGGNWKQSSMQGLFRQRPAVIGGIYDAEKNVFIDSQPYLSWTLNSNDDWESPLGAMPSTTTDGKKDYYSWNESNQSWDKIN